MSGTPGWQARRLGATIFAIALAIAIDWDRTAAEVIVVDADGGDGRGSLLRVDADGGTHVVAAGDQLRDPADAVEEDDGSLVVVDETAAALIAVDSTTALQRVLFRGPPLIRPRGLARDSGGTLWVADRTTGGLGAILRATQTANGVDVTVFATLPAPVADVVAMGGYVFAATTSGTGIPIVVRLDAQSNQNVVGGGSELGDISSLAVGGTTQILLSDATPGAPAIHRVDMTTVQNGVVTARGLLRRPAGLVLDPSGTILVVDDERGALIGVSDSGDQRFLTAAGTFKAGRSVIVTRAAHDPGGPGATCGNGILETGEDCDDGNQSDGDCCSSTCAPVWDGTACDDGNPSTTGDACFGGRCTGATAKIEIQRPHKPIPCRARHGEIKCKDRSLVCRFQNARRDETVACEATGTADGEVVVSRADEGDITTTAACSFACSERQATGRRRGKRVVLRLTLTNAGRRKLEEASNGKLSVTLEVRPVDEDGNPGRLTRQLLFRLRSG